MKKMIAFSTAAAMMLTMGTAAFADISTGIVGEEKNEWPNEFGFGGEIKVVRGEEALSYPLAEENEFDLQPGDTVYLPLYYTTKEGESVTIGASKEEMTGHVPYTGSINKNWKLNFIDKSKDMIETAELYKANSSDKALVKGAVYVKAQTKAAYNSLDDLEFNIGVFVSERYTQNKTEQIQLKGVYSNPKSENMVDFEWENQVFEKAVWEVAEDQDGTATFNFNDDAYYTVKMFGGDKVMLDFDRTYNKEVANRYTEDLYFYNFRGDLDSFSATGTLTIPVEEEMYLYEVVNGALKTTNAVYNEENEAMELKTRNLGEYVLTPSKLDLSAETENEGSDNNSNENNSNNSGNNGIVEETPSQGENQENNDYLGGGNSDKGNPDTGAEDLAGLMTAMAVVSLTGIVLLGKKKR